MRIDGSHRSGGLGYKYRLFPCILQLVAIASIEFSCLPIALHPIYDKFSEFIVPSPEFHVSSMPPAHPFFVPGVQEC
jgi:hypothetical protein